jgi:hypothetical protein
MSVEFISSLLTDVLDHPKSSLSQYNALPRIIQSANPFEMPYHYHDKDAIFLQFSFPLIFLIQLSYNAELPENNHPLTVLFFDPIHDEQSNDNQKGLLCTAVVPFFGQRVDKLGLFKSECRFVSMSQQ